MTYYDSCRDPVGTTMTAVFHWRSSASSGASTTVLDDLYIPDSANFPPPTTGSPTRYMINLPGEAYYDGIEAGTHPMVVVNRDTTVTLTRVAYNASLAANTYKVFPGSVETPARMEVHVGVGSGAAGDKISYDGYFINTILPSTFNQSFNTLQTVSTASSSIYSAGHVTAGSGFYGIRHFSTRAGFASQLYVYDEVIDIGPWDMTSSVGKAVGHNIGTTNQSYIIHVSAMIFPDSLLNPLPINMINGSSDMISQGGITYISSTGISLYRATTSYFNSTAFVTATNRGYIYIKYLSTENIV